jgi:general secretion pathway protein M
MQSLPTWIGRAAALSLLLALIGAIFIFAVQPLSRVHQETDDAIDAAGESLRRYERLAATRPALQKQFEQVRAQQDSSGFYLTGETDGLAAAELQDLVNATIAANGGQLRSIQILPAKAEGEFKRVSVRVQFTTTIERLARILYALEAGRTYLFIDNLDIRNRRARSRKKEPDPEGPKLTVRFDLYGYLRPDVG